MRYLLLIGIMIAFVIAGCVTPPETQAPPKANVSEEKENCSTVTENVPYTEEECGNISVTEQVCGIRKLNYSVTRLPKVDLCISEGVCNGKPLGDCQACTVAMTRCILVIRNDEQIKSGTWSVGANYSLDHTGFIKDPISMSIGPNQSYAFDFNQIYNPGQPIGSASCTLSVVSEPSVEDCIEETKSTSDCRNVTKSRAVEKEVCE